MRYLINYFNFEPGLQLTYNKHNIKLKLVHQAKQKLLQFKEI